MDILPRSKDKLNSLSHLSVLACVAGEISRASAFVLESPRGNMAVPPPLTHLASYAGYGSVISIMSPFSWKSSCRKHQQTFAALDYQGGMDLRPETRRGRIIRSKALYRPIYRYSTVLKYIIFLTRTRPVSVKTFSNFSLCLSRNILSSREGRLRDEFKECQRRRLRTGVIRWLPIQ